MNAEVVFAQETVEADLLFTGASVTVITGFFAAVVVFVTLVVMEGIGDTVLVVAAFFGTSQQMSVIFLQE